MSATREQAEEAARRAKSKHAKPNGGPKPNGAAPPMISADELMELDFPEVKWIVPDVLCEGLTVFAGRPKLGKSWLMLDFALAVSSSGRALGHFACEPGAVLLLALEDSRRRLKSRLRRIGIAGGADLTLCVEWPRIDDGAVEAIEAWIARNPAARLIVIDTLSKVRPLGVSNKDAYQADADALRTLHRLANDRAIAIVVVHHTRKAQSDDWLDSISGTTGLSGVADSTIVLKRERGQADAFLFGTGRDLPDYEMPLKFDEQTCLWRWLDMVAPEARASSEQTAIIRVLRNACGAGLMQHQIAKMTDRSKQATSQMLRRMEDAGLVETKGNLWHLTV
jgi:predicted ATP-dependent serine protease